MLEHGESVASIARDWTAPGIKPVAARQWWQTSIVGTLISPRLAGLREWQGQKYPTTQWPAIIDTDTHERLVRMFADPARRKHVVRAPAHLLSGIATCPKCGRGCCRFSPGAFGVVGRCVRATRSRFRNASPSVMLLLLVVVVAAVRYENGGWGAGICGEAAVRGPVLDGARR